MTKEDREKLADIYARQCYEGMDYKTLFQFVYDNIQDFLRDFDDTEFYNLMLEYFGEDEIRERLGNDRLN